MPQFFTLALLAFAVLLLSSDPVVVQTDALKDRQTGEVNYVLIAGSIIVFLIYWAKFAEWADEKIKPRGFPLRPTRHFTTWLQYQIWAGIYAMVGVLIVWSIYLYPSITSLFEALPLPESWARSLRRDMLQEPIDPQSTTSAVLGVALAVAAMGLPKAEPYLRSALQRAALIPVRATSLTRALTDDFSRFVPEPADVGRFLDDQNIKDGSPHLFPEDFDPRLRDEHALEIYPRIEFILWRLSMLSPNEQITFGIDQFEKDLREIEIQVTDIRKSIKGFGQTLERLYSDRFPGEIEALHEELGYDRGPDDESSVLLYDNILREIGKWSGRPSEEEKVVTTYMNESLAELRGKCEPVLDALLQILVLMSLRSRFDKPEKLLALVGFGSHEAARQADSWDRLLWLNLTVVIGSVAVALVYSLALPNTNDWLIATQVFGMLFPAILGGHFIAHLILYDEVGFGESARNPQGSIQQYAMSFVTSWSLVIIGLALLQGIDDGYSPAANFYAQVPALIGAYSAVVVFRSHRALPICRIRDVFVVPVLAAVGGLFGAMISSSSQDFLAALEGERLYVTMTGMIASAVLGLIVVIGIFLFQFIFQYAERRAARRFEAA